MPATARLRRLAAAGVAAALVAAPTVAEAKAGCELIAVLLAKGDARLRGVGVAINAKGLVDATLDAKPAILRDALECDLDSVQSGFELDCSWDYAVGEEAAAERDFARLAGRVNACLPDKLEAVEPKIYTEAEIVDSGTQYGPSFAEYLRTYRVLGQFEGSYPVDDDVSFEIDLSLSRDGRNGVSTLSAQFRRL